MLGGLQLLQQLITDVSFHLNDLVLKYNSHKFHKIIVRNPPEDDIELEHGFDYSAIDDLQHF